MAVLDGIVVPLNFMTTKHDRSPYQIQEKTISGHFAPGMRCLVFGFTVEGDSNLVDFVEHQHHLVHQNLQRRREGRTRRKRRKMDRRRRRGKYKRG